MAKDLIIGGASNYTYDQVKYWINSIQKSGFDGDIVLVATNMKHTDLTKIAERGVNLLVYGQRDDNGDVRNVNSKFAPHVERFFYLWNFLSQVQDKYRYVITTDVRDVVFQSNPIEYMKDHSLGAVDQFFAASEGLLYRDEPWGNGNYELAFGPFFHARMKDNMIYNVGVMAGTHQYVQDMLLLIFQLSINRPFEVVDQAVYNFILNVGVLEKGITKLSNDSGWTCNLGTTIRAVESGEGDLGGNALKNPVAMENYKNSYLDAQPIIQDGVVISPVTNLPYAIVHQYDRVRGLDFEMRKRFND